MNSADLKAAIKQLYVTNRDVLVADLTLPGRVVKINQITTASLTAFEIPVGLGIEIVNVYEFFDVSALGGSARRQSQQSKNKRVRYNMEIDVGAYVSPTEGERTGGETEFYETYTAVMDKVADRVVQVLRDNPSIPPISPGTHTIEVYDDRESGQTRGIRRVNRHRRDDDIGSHRGLFHAVISFAIEVCGDEQAA